MRFKAWHAAVHDPDWFVPQDQTAIFDRSDLSLVELKPGLAAHIRQAYRPPIIAAAWELFGQLSQSNVVEVFEIIDQALTTGFDQHQVERRLRAAGLTFNRHLGGPEWSCRQELACLKEMVEDRLPPPILEVCQRAFSQRRMRRESDSVVSSAFERAIVQAAETWPSLQPES
jgi:hypothetical protein